jgi:hypothetical protein
MTINPKTRVKKYISSEIRRKVIKDLKEEEIK